MQADANIPLDSQQAHRGGSGPLDRHTAAADKARTMLNRAEALYARIDVAYEELTIPPEALAAAYANISAAFDDLAAAIVELSAVFPRTTIRTILARSVPIVSGYLLCLLDTPEARATVFAQAFLYAAVLVARCTRGASGNIYDESVHKCLNKGFLERICGGVGVGVFCMLYPHYGATAATGLTALAMALVCLVIAAAIRYVLPPDAYGYLRTAVRKHVTHAGAQPPPPGGQQSPAAAHASYRADVTSQLAAVRPTLRLAGAPRPTTRDACAALAGHALHGCAPVAVCYLGLFWPARGAPIVSALSVIFLSDVLIPGTLDRRMSAASLLTLAFITWSIGIRIYHAAHPLYGAVAAGVLIAKALEPDSPNPLRDHVWNKL
ncbi:hypothetical protein FA95DRAFT_1680435 [Auriscalpium vulgare]|uniref:Uncharacterized protein n=1 Tax=Auriscalpium vulgare TaxID=40419 RepID=A0ACB8RNK2_9AGAM|nr:hypothetical protein FA95DRAFT_1680435 [Auriscalpium vulgare]